MDRKETYLYGTYLALIREQLAALDKLTNVTLGFWGKSRVGGRTKEMGKFLQKIVNYKLQAGVGDPFLQMKEDLSLIENETNVWGDIRKEEIEFLRNAIDVFTNGA